jgi:hydroxylaminobenzene mutase
MSDSYSDEARLLARGAAWLVVLGLLTGVLVSGAMTGKIAASERAMLASHLNALLGAFWMLGVAWSLPMLRYGSMGRRRIAWALLVANFANWIVTALKAFLHVAGVDRTGETRNDVVFALLVVFVIAPSLGASIAWAAGFKRAAPAN